MIQPIILAAGKGTRMLSDLPKALFPIAGKPLMRRVIDSLVKVKNAKPPLLVIGHKAELITEEFGDEFTCILQTEISGTASAVKICAPHLLDGDGVFILYVDHPFIEPESIDKIREMFEKNPDALILGTVSVPDFDDWRAAYIRFGRIIRQSDGTLQRIVEYKNATQKERAIKEVNPALYCVEASWLKKALSQVQANELTGEYYLTDIVSIAVSDKKRILTVDLTPQEALGVNDLDDVKRAEALLR